MLRVVVFDSGWGGEMFADYLEREVKVLDVIRVIDWGRGNYCERSKRCVRAMVEARLQEYIGKVELIVLASYTITEATLMYLIEKYPAQKFMGFRPRLAGKLRTGAEADFLRQLAEYRAQLRLKERIRFSLNGYGGSALSRVMERSRRGAVVILASDAVRKSPEYRNDIRELVKEYRVLEPRCDEWAQQLDDGMEVSEMTFSNLPMTQNVKAVLIYGTTFMRMRGVLKQVYGWQVKIYDDFCRSTKEVCRMLSMKT